MTDSLRQSIHDYMAANAAQHAGWAYPGLMSGDTARQLFALLTDIALACLMEIEADLADPGPGQSLAAASGLTAKATLLTALGENLDRKNSDPAAVPVNRWTTCRVTAGPGPGP